MGAVFAAAAQAPLTAIASVVEMTGNFTLVLPVMLAVGIAAGVSKQLSYGTIYTTKLLRRGTDIERPRPASLLQVLTVADTMQPLPHPSAPLWDRRPSGPPPRTAPSGHSTPTTSGPGRWAGWSTFVFPRSCRARRPSSRPYANWSSTAQTASPSFPPTAARSSAGSPATMSSTPWPPVSPPTPPTPPRPTPPPNGLRTTVRLAEEPPRPAPGPRDRRDRHHRQLALAGPAGR